MKSRPAARLLVLDPQGRVLLFRFVFTTGALAGQDFWATPGGGLDEGETFEQAAVRELFEETGLRIDKVDAHVAEHTFVLQMPEGDHVMAQERFFLVETAETTLSRAGMVPGEVDVIVEHRWWTMDDLARTEATVWPKNLPDMIAQARRN